jgi:hypothetical protein
MANFRMSRLSKRFAGERSFHSALSVFLFSYVFGIQIFGIFKLLYRGTVLFTFLSSLLLAGYYARFNINDLHDFFPKFLLNLHKFKKTEILVKVQTFILMTIVATTGLISLFVVPNNWDSMTYHLPRMEHWFQNHSLWFYNTNIDRQLWMQSLNSHLFLIPKSLNLPESAFNLIQYFAYLSILFIAWEILRKQKVSPRFAISTLLVIACLPNLLTEASTTQSDVLAALALLLNFIPLLKIIKQNLTWRITFEYAITFALATFTKGTLYPYLFISGIVFLVTVLKVFKIRSLPRIFLILTFTISLNIFTWAQSIAEFGSISGPQTTPARFIQSPISSGYWPKDLLVAILHFMTYNMQSFSYQLNFELFNAASKICAFLGLNIYSHSNSWPNWNPSDNSFTYIFQPSFGVNEDSAVTPQILIILFLVIFNLVQSLRIRRIGVYIPFALTGLYFFSTIAFLRWNPFVGRYYIPVTLMGIFCLFIYGSKTRKVEFILVIFSLIAALYSSPFLVRSELRPIFGQNTFLGKSVLEQRFVEKSNLFTDFKKLDTVISSTHPSSIELSIGGDDWEYPFWTLANKYRIPIYDYRDKDILKGPNPLLVCYVDCKGARIRTDTFILLKPPSKLLNSPGILRFNAPNLNNILTEGWGGNENWGTWSIANVARMELQTSSTFYRSTSLEIRARSLSIPHSSRRVKVFVNSREFEEIDLNELSTRNEIQIPFDFLKQFKGMKELKLEFDFSGLMTPSEAGLSSDTRKLGIGIESITAINK